MKLDIQPSSHFLYIHLAIKISLEEQEISKQTSRRCPQRSVFCPSCWK
ncbi:hypothetical protein V1477_000128 [Vespula maculifrons]|uniref:Uncharacterized protein n=1 Tax=Vespula maculifrons TaxID=7453 RepID=A0ABD2D2U7_VESMC